MEDVKKIETLCFLLTEIDKLQDKHEVTQIHYDTRDWSLNAGKIVFDRSEPKFLLTYNPLRLIKLTKLKKSYLLAQGIGRELTEEESELREGYVNVLEIMLDQGVKPEVNPILAIKHILQSMREAKEAGKMNEEINRKLNSAINVLKKLAPIDEQVQPPTEDEALF